MPSFVADGTRLLGGYFPAFAKNTSHTTSRLRPGIFQAPRSLPLSVLASLGVASLGGDEQRSIALSAIPPLVLIIAAKLVVLSFFLPQSYHPSSHSTAPVSQGGLQPLPTQPSTLHTTHRDHHHHQGSSSCSRALPRLVEKQGAKAKLLLTRRQ